MPKSKSSASAGTRKKHLKKSAGKEGEDGAPAAKAQPRQRGQKKLSKAQQRAMPKIKQFVPPPKPPAPPIPDPLDGQGLARTLPAELVVVLRRLGKKDDVTRRKGLEELREGWVVEVAKTGLGEDEEIERETKESALECAVPVWMHNLASLLQSPFHRNTAIQLHAELLAIPSLRSAILDTLSLSLLPGTQNRDVLGSWLVAGLEEGRRGGGAGLRSWDDSTVFLKEGEEANGRIDLGPHLTTLVEYLSLSILDPPSLHDDIHPAPVSSAPVAPPPQKGGKGPKGKQAYTAGPSAPVEPTNEELEMTGEKWARYRVGGLTGLAWLLQQLKTSELPMPVELSQLIHVPTLWSSLSSLSTEDDSSDFGHQHPTVRRAAYSVLGVLVDSYPEEIAKPELLQILASEMLDTIWLEKETTVWETAGNTVIKVLSKHRDIWTMGSTSAETKKPSNDEGADNEDDDDEDDSDDEDDDDEADEDDPQEAAKDVSNDAATSSVAFDRFLEFISTICPTIPHRTYPLLLVIISTLPSSLLPLSTLSSQVKTLFAHLWSPVDARLLSTHALPGQPSAFQAFLRDAVDCTTFLINKAGKEEGGDETREWLVLDQLGERVWKEGVIELGGRSAGRRTIQGARTEQEATIFGQALARLQASSPDLASKLVDVVVQSTAEAVSQEDDARKAVAMLPRVLPVITAVKAVNEDDAVIQKLDGAIGQVASVCAKSLESSTNTPSPTAPVYTETLVEIVKSHPTLLPAEAKATTVQLFESSSSQLAAQLSPTLYVSLLDALATTAEEDQRSLTSSMDRLLQSQDVEQDTRFAVVKSLLASGSNALSSEALDTVAEEATQTALASEEPAATEVAAACVTHDRISHDSLHTILALVSTSIHDSVYDLLTAHPEARVPQAAVQIFAEYAQTHLSEVINSDIFSRALIGLHHLVVLLPRLHETGHSVPKQAKTVWDETTKLEGKPKADMTQKILGDLAGLVQDISCRVEPSILVDVALVIEGSAQAADIADRILPETSLIQDLVSEITSRTPHSALSISDALISPSTDVGNEAGPSSGFDARGRSKAARLAEAALAFIRADRQLASTSPNLLQIVLSARALAQDGLAVPGASRGFLNSAITPSYLEEVIREAEGALSFSLSAFDEVSIDWHKATVELLKKEDAGKGDFLQKLLVTLVMSVKGSEDDVAARIVRDVLAKHLRQCGAGEKDADIWLAYAMTKATSNSTLALAILLAVKPLMLDTKPFETAQNRLASSLSGIPAQQANEKGVPALLLLVASAPPPDAASVFIPQQRAIFVLRHVASWLTSDDADDLDEEVEARIAELYTVMAPIVQSVQGAHWDSIFDLIETGLDSSSMEDPSTYGLLYNCLILLREVRDLCASNKALKATWTSKKTHLGLALKLFLQCRNADSTPVQMIQTLLLDLLRDAGDDTVGDSGLPELCDLIGKSNSASVQTTAYRLLSQVIKRKTLALVLEAEVSVSEVEDNQPARKIELPEGLVGIVQQGQAVDWHEEPAMELVLGQLLAWMSVLDHFDDASRTLRWGYLDQLNSSDLLVNSLLPMLFAILGVSEVGAWNFPASSFAVDEFYPDLLQPEELADLSPLASHVFYRTLVTIPSAIRTYYEALKDRQLSMSMLNFVARHYSPVIIAHEFAALRQPAAMAQLTEEGLNIRIAQGGGATVAAGGGSSEAIASYVVDEQPMEIGIRLPAEFPLRGVDVRDLRRVGVPENKWRGWLMSVQQTITSRNGLILEALTVFKKNVSLHFEGVVECAICYSIISLTDRTLPTKPCRTCKNRFHASCLYKWFNSSHSSSCPMCRALF